MFRSKWTINRFRALAMSVTVLALFVAAFFFTGQQQLVTVAKAAANTQQTIFLVPGSVLDIIGTGSGGQIQAPTSFSTFYQQMYLTDGYVLELNGTSGQVISPANTLNQPGVFPQSTSVQTIYLTDGYVLVLNGTSGQVITP